MTKGLLGALLVWNTDLFAASKEQGWVMEDAETALMEKLHTHTGACIDSSSQGLGLAPSQEQTTRGTSVRREHAPRGRGAVKGRVQQATKARAREPLAGLVGSSAAS